MESTAAQVKVNFTTTHEDLQLPENKRQLLVPSDIKRYGLSRILNSESMLNTSAPVPLDFLVNGTFLRTTLEEYLQTEGLSSETTVTLQYVRSLLPPTYEASFQHDDWVASVDVLSATSAAGRWSGDDLIQGQDRILSASYDGLVRIWDGSGSALATSAAARGGGHAKMLTSAKFLSATQIASAGLDQKVVVWKYTEAADRLSGELKPTLELHGHKQKINSLAAHGPSKRLLTASNDGTVGLWLASKKAADADAEDIPATHTAKRARVASSVTVPQKAPLALIAAHGDAAATAAAFHPTDATVAYSASTDHTLRTLDLTTARVVSTLTTLHPLLALAPLPRSAHALYTEAADRLSGELKPTLELHGHKQKINSLAAHGPSKRLLTASNDGTVGLWLASKKAADADAEDIPATHTAKRARVASSVTVPQKAPLALIAAHGDAAATAAAFHPTDATVAYSASTDHTLRTLDLTTARVVSTLTTLHPLLALAPLPRSAHALVAAASAARHVTLLDPRAAAAQTSVLTLRGHANMVSALAPAPDNDYSLVSASHDGTCKVWDLRSVRPATRDEGGAAAGGGSVCEPVYTVARESLGGRRAPLGGEGVKVFDVAWDATWGIVSGGEDKKVQINRGRDLLSHVCEPVYTVARESLGGRRAPLGGEGVKVFDVAWDATWGIVSGGEDKKVQINRGRDLLSQ
ncbi:hypothetical protein BN1708_001209, partial [Verticillium longisporum]